MDQHQGFSQNKLINQNLKWLSFEFYNIMWSHQMVMANGHNILWLQIVVEHCETVLVLQYLALETNNLYKWAVLLLLFIMSKRAWSSCWLWNCCGGRALGTGNHKGAWSLSCALWATVLPRILPTALNIGWVYKSQIVLDEIRLPKMRHWIKNVWQLL